MWVWKGDLPRCKVILSLTSKQRQRDKNPECENDGLQHYLTRAVVDKGPDDDADGVRLQRCEAAQEDEVGRVALAFPESQQHEADGAEEGEPHHPLVGLDPGAVGGGEEGYGGEGGGKEDCVGFWM